MRTCLLLAALALALAPAAALAQDRQPPPAAGPLVLERIDNSFVVAPDFKLTDLDGRTGELVGATAGWRQENTLFVGGAGYWLTDNSSDRKLTYGGLVLGWTLPAEQRFQVGARGLVGVGSATLGTDLTLPVRPARDFRPRGGPPLPIDGSTRHFRLRDDFFVFEPQATFSAAVTRRVRVSLAGGYRLAGMVEALGDRLNGATGNVALEFRLN
jgi:opacity protein-like surface antigen